MPLTTWPWTPRPLLSLLRWGSTVGPLIRALIPIVRALPHDLVTPKGPRPNTIVLGIWKVNIWISGAHKYSDHNSPLPRYPSRLLGNTETLSVPSHSYALSALLPLPKNTHSVIFPSHFSDQSSLVTIKDPIQTFLLYFDPFQSYNDFFFISAHWLSYT